jgi:flagellar hook-associated protein 3 FlgL
MISSSRLLPFAAGLARSSQNTELLGALKSRLDDLQRQLSSGKRAQTYGGLGAERVSALTFRAQLGESQGYQEVMSLTEIRLSTMTQRTSELGKITEAARSAMLRTRGTGGYPEITSAKQQVQASFEQMISTLNAQHEGMYLFSGRARDVKPVVDANSLMFGNGTEAGLRQVIDERRQADLGVTGLGRMTTSLVGATATLSEDAAVNPFGIKLVAGSVGGGMSNIAISGPAGAPQAIAFAFSGQPATGERISFSVTLPDGKTMNLGFSVDQPGASEDTVFAVGATPADTAANLQSAIISRLTSIGTGELRSASALKAANDFFSGSPTNPPPRVVPPFASSVTQNITGTYPTVLWYKGDADPAFTARDTQKSKIDLGTSVSLGGRANEAAYRDSLVAMGLFLAEDYPPNQPSTQLRFEAATQRAIDLFGSTGGPGAILEINGEFGRATAQLRETKTRHTDQTEFLKGLLGEIENIKNEEVAVELVTLQTQLQASYQTTARLSQLSLTNYL